MKGIIVGLGGWGSGWSQVIRDSGWDISAWVDVNAAALEHAVKDLGADPESCYSSLDDAIREVRAEAAFIITPPAAGRARDIITAMDAGLHVLAEKPLTTTLEETRAILEHSRSTCVKLMVAQNYRWFPGAIRMRQMVERGELGALGYANVLYHMMVNMPGSHVHSMEHALMLAMSIHHLDTMRFVLGADPETIRAETWNPPWSWWKSDSCASFAFRFPGDVHVNYFAGWATHRNETDWFGDWRLEFERGAFVTDGVKMTRISGGEPTEIPGRRVDATHTRYDVLREFTSAIQDDRTPECSVEDNVRSLLTAFAIIESSRTGEEIDFGAFAQEHGVGHCQIR